MKTPEYLDEKTFEANVKKNTQELSALVEKYAQEEKESKNIDFSIYDPLKNIILGLAAKLRDEHNLEADESLAQADEIVRKAEQEVKNPVAKKRICAALKSFSGDAVTLTPWILPVLLQLSKAGVIAIAFEPSGVALASAACLVVVRMGVESFCAE